MKRILSSLLLAILLSVSSMVQTSISGYNVEHTIIFDTIFDIENDLEKVYYSDNIIVGRVINVEESVFSVEYDYF